MTYRSRTVAIGVALIVSLIALWFLVEPEPSYACECFPPGSPSEELANSTAVFMGQVISIREFERSDNSTSGADPTTVEFDVQTVWKGSNYGTMFLTTRRDESACGFSFRKGETYVVYSHDGSTVSLCSRTRRLSDAAADLAELGEGSVPVQDRVAPTPDLSEYQTGGGCGLSPNAPDLSVVGLMVGFALLGLRKKPSGTS